MKPSRCLPLLAALALAACARTYETTYAPPPGLTAATGATVTGSKATDAATGHLNRIVVAGIDAVPTEAMNSVFQEWDAVVLVPPGPHQVELRSYLVKFPNQYLAAAVIPLDARAGEAYVIRGLPRATAANGVLMVDLWAETASGERASPVVGIPAYAPCDDTLLVPGTKSTPTMVLPHACPKR